MIAGLALLLQTQVGVAVRPETVTVGQHFTATVHVRTLPRNVVQSPVGTARPETVDTAAATVRRDTVLYGMSDVTVIYTLAAWDTGTVNLGLGDVVVQGTTGEQRFPLGSKTIRVRSVLPADTALRVPKPARPLIEIVPFNWLPWIIAAIVAVLLGLGAWLWAWFRKRSRRPVPAITWAEREFQRIEALRLLEKGNPEEHAILMTEVVREYLARQFPGLRTSATTRELAARIRAYRVVPGDRTIRLFESVDLLKFADRHTTIDDARALGTESRALVQRVETDLTAERAAQKAESAKAKEAA